MKTVVAIHTAMPLVEPTKELYARHMPDDQMGFITFLDKIIY